MPGSVIASLVEDYEKQVLIDPLQNKAREKVVSRWRSFLAFLFIDVLICFFIIGPSVVAFWRGVWDNSVLILDKYEVNGYLGNGLAFGLGFLGTLQIDMFHLQLSSRVGQPGSLSHSFYTRAFSTAWGLLDILLWKGVWDGVDCLTGGRYWAVSVSTLAVGLSVLTAAGALKSALSMPVGIVVDEADEHILSCTYLESNKEDSLFRRLNDGLVSRCLEICVVLCWHGIWTLIDFFTLDVFGMSYPESLFLSLVAGFTGIMAIFCLQFVLLAMAPSLHNNEKEKLPIWWLFINFLYTFLGIVVTILCFRGVWYGLDEFYLPNNQHISYVSATIIGYLLLLAFGCISCLHAGIYRDDPRLGISITFYFLSHKQVISISQKLNFTTANQESKDLLNKEELLS